jgi:glycosyltransferase involved in cell wall biosynthesis
MAPEKGPVDAINVARALGKRLIMAAAVHPWERQYFQQEVVPIIDGDQISFVGEVDDARKCELLRDAEALINPVRWEEPFGIACVEALACGTPVIALRRGAMPEIVEDGVNGILCATLSEMVDRYDEVREIDRHMCRRIAEERFDGDLMVRRYCDLYECLLGGP